MPNCEHHDFEAIVEVNRIIDKGRFSADIQIKCLGCGLPFRFIGARPGSSPDFPTVNIDGTVLAAPIEPEIIKFLHDTMHYDVT